MKDSGSDLTKYLKTYFQDGNLEPVDGGRFADVYRLPFNEQSVAVKVIRVHSFRGELVSEEVSKVLPSDVQFLLFEV